MSVVAFALVVKSKTGSDDAAARLARERLWRAAGRGAHVHDYRPIVDGVIYGCTTCESTVSLVTP